MRFVSPSKDRRLARETAAKIAATQAAVADAEGRATVYRSALVTVSEAVAAVKVPNGTTKRLGRIADEALQGEIGRSCGWSKAA
jgi:hypothetical protein